MRAGQVTAPATLQWVDVPEPSASDLAPGEVIARVSYGGICGSDLPYFTDATTFTGDAPGPGMPLHEIVATIVATRDDSLTIGDVVVGWAGNNDALAQYVRTPGADLALIGDLDPAEAVVAQPLACVFATLERFPTPWVGKHVAIIGLGPIGLLFAHVLSQGGAGRITGVDPVHRVPEPAAFGVDDAVTDTAENWATGIGDEDQPAVVIEVVGHQPHTLASAVEAVAPRGSVFYFGVPETVTYPLSMVAMLRKHLTLQSGTTEFDRRRHLTRALAYLREHPALAGELITDVFTVADAHRAYALAAAQRPGHAKVVLDLSGLG